MESKKTLSEIKQILDEIEKEYKQCSLKLKEIQELIDKLMIVIEVDNFNTAEAYNYCKILKELIKKRRNYHQIIQQCKTILKLINSNFIAARIKEKEKFLSNRKYNAKILKDETRITECIN